VELCLRELENSGFVATADVVQTPEEFSERMRSERYDLVLADYRLPNWTGMDALKFLKQQEKDVPFILVTGTLGEEAAVDCIKEGAADYVLKDHLARLPVAVRRALAEKTLHEERARALEALRESEMRFRTLAETVACAIFIYQDTHLRYVNPMAVTMTGYTREELLAIPFWEIAHADFRELVKDRGLARQQGERVPPRYEIKILTKQGEERWLDLTAERIDFEGKPAGLGTAFDITERKRMEEQVQHLAASDALTGLANYGHFLEVLDGELKRSQRTGRNFAVLLFDLDDLKKINDRYGHLVGSRALVRLADVLRLHCRAIDTAARFGGDEFAVILPETGVDGAQQVASRISEQVAQDSEQSALSASFGIAVYPRDGETIEALLGAADRGLYEMKARRSGKPSEARK
jgi:diguanylate cyclase (GGDEF)-like protein/PAS domain S-box-containing protein